MKAIVLAAGNAHRLRPLTNDTPKPMLKVAGRPILEHNVRLLIRHGIRDVIINLHHRPDVIKSYFGDGSWLGARILYSHESELCGTSGAVKKVADYLDDTFLVLYGDNLTNCNLTRLIQFHQISSGCATLALFHRDDVSASGVVELDGARILRFLEKPAPHQALSHLVYAGISAMEPSTLCDIPDGVSDFGREVFPTMIRHSRPIIGYRMSERENLWWVDTPQDYTRTLATVRADDLQ